MKNEKIIEIVEAVAKFLNEEDKKSYDFIKNHSANTAEFLKYCDAAPAALAILYNLALADMQTETAKAAGNAAKAKAAQRIIEQLAKVRPDHGAYIDDATGEYIVFGSYSGVRLKEQFAGAPEICRRPRETWIDYKRFFRAMEDQKGESSPVFRLPTLKKITDYIKVEKAAHKGERGYRVLYSLGEYLPTVDAEILRDLVVLLGDQACAVVNAKNRILGNIYAWSDAGDAILCPTNDREKVKKWNEAQAVKVG